jgi:diguanylate cyclase (GGDEF)-like protein
LVSYSDAIDVCLRKDLKRRPITSIKTSFLPIYRLIGLGTLGELCRGMDYGTFFFTNIASVTVFTVCIGVLAWYNRRATGMLWFAGSQVVGLAKLILQGLEGKAPVIWTSMTANELYLISIAMQWIGLYWFVVRKPIRYRRLWIPIGAVLAAYTLTFLLRISYTGNVVNIPYVALCGFSAWTLWKYRSGPFSVVARVSAAIIGGQMCVAAYRAILTNISYAQPWKTVDAHADSRWLYSLAAAAFLAACVAMCQMWFLVTELQGELARRARTDSLTGALNRRSMEEIALRETARSLRYGNALSMIVIDIDNFKHLNDTRGHAAGDSALQALVRRLNCMLRQQDLLARMGGEEFAILLPDTTSEAALIIAERVRQTVAELEVSFETGPVRMTICAGVAQLDLARGWEEMMRRADAAMYEAKRRGRNLVSARCEPESAAEKRAAELDRFKLLHTA